MKLRWLPIVSALLLWAALAAVPPVAAQESEPAETAGATAEAEQTTFHFLVYMRDSCIGYLTIAAEEVGIEGEIFTRTTEKSFISIKREFDNQVFEMHEESESLAREDGSPVSKHAVKKNGEQTTTVDVEWGELTVKITEDVDGSSKTYEIERTEDLLTDDQAWRKLKAEDRLEKGEKFSFKSLDESSKTVQDVAWTISGKSTRKLRSGEEVEGISVKQVANSSVNKVLVDDDGVPFWIEMQGVFVVERVDELPEEFKVDSVEGLGDVMEANVVILKYSDIEWMELHFAFAEAEEEGVEALFDANAYHEVVRYDEDGETGYALRLKAQKLPADYKAKAFPMAEGDVAEDVSVYLDATPMCQSDDKVLLAKARELTKDAKDSVDAARKLCNFVYRYLNKKSGTTGSASARQAYDDKEGDCTEHAALFVALARAVGLPARNCGGIVYAPMSRKRAIFGYHAWAEVWVGQWVPVDATVDEVGVSARYLFMDYSEPGHSEGDSRISRCIAAGIKPSIDAYKLAGDKPKRLKGAKRFFGEETKKPSEDKPSEGK